MNILNKALRGLFLCLIFGSSLATDFYVRPLGGTYGAENGTSYAAAFDGFVDISGVAAGDTVYICGTHNAEDNVCADSGSVHSILCTTASGTAGNPIVYDGNCSGDPGKLVTSTGNGVAIFATGDDYITVKNLEVLGTQTTPGSYLISVLADVTAGSVTGALSADAVSGWTFDNNIIHGPGVWETGNPAYDCLRIIGSSNTVTRNEIYDCPSDGMSISGNSNVIGGSEGYGNRIYQIDVQTSTETGDPIQWESGAGSEYNHTGNTISWNYLKNDTSAKHGMIMACDSDDSASAGNIIEHNTIYAGADALDLNWCTGITIRRNFLIAQEPTGGLIIGRCGGVADCALSLDIHSNILLNPGHTTISYGIKFQEGPTGAMSIKNNTIFNIGLGGTDRAIYWIDSAATENGALSIFNNYISGTTVGMRIEPTGTTYTAGDQYFYNVTTRYSAGGQDETGTGDTNASVDCAFVGGTNPNTADGFRLKAESACRGTGTIVGSVQDFGNRRFAYPPSIGAWESASGDERSTVTARTTVTPR